MSAEKRAKSSSTDSEGFVLHKRNTTQVSRLKGTPRKMKEIGIFKVSILCFITPEHMKRFIDFTFIDCKIFTAMVTCSKCNI